MRVRSAVGAVLAVALVVGACSGGDDGPPTVSTAAASAGTSADAAVTPVSLEDPLVFGVEDAPAELLAEPKLTNRNLELIDRTRQDRGFCDGWSAITALPEPDPSDFDELVDWTNIYFNSLKRIDQRTKVPDPESSNGRQLPLPDEVKALLDESRQAMYEYQVRLVHAAGLRAAREETTPEQVDKYLRYAFLKLASGPFATADTVLGRFWDLTCRR